MSGARKRELLAASELNRVQLAAEVQALVAGTRSFADQAIHHGRRAWAAAERGAEPPASEESWFGLLSALIDGCGAVADLWRMFRPRGNRP